MIIKNFFNFFGKHRFFTQVLSGFVILVLVIFSVSQSDMISTRHTLATTTGYIKEQCNQYARIKLASETKSLMRIIESSKQISHELDENRMEITSESLKRIALNNYVSGVLLLNSSGNIVSEYHTEGQAPDSISESLNSTALLDTAAYPQKRYAIRIHCDDGSEIDLAATARSDANGIVAAYYHTPAEYLNAFNLSVAFLLSGYTAENNTTIVVTSNNTVIASNNNELVGTDSNTLPILRKLNTTQKENKLVHTNQRDKSLSQYFGLMQRGRDFYVYSFLPERNVFTNTLPVAFFTLIAYILILALINEVRRKAEQETQKEYAEQLRIKNEQLSIAVQEAERANAAKTDFLSRMSHDIRTPLNGIIGLLEINSAHPDNTQLINSNRNKMRIAADYLLSLINDILQMSKLESGAITLVNEPLHLNMLCKEILTIIEQRASESGITMEYDKNSDIAPHKYVYGSPLHLRQIFLNIYINCIKYNKPGGSISTRLQCVNSTENKVTYRWTITDTGIGMSENFLKHIFDPFTQENTDARSIYQGTGLGMAIVKRLVEQMNGSISVSSKEGIGSAFVITLPFETANEKDIKTPKKIKPQQNNLQGLSLMLAEDNELNAEIAMMLLSDKGVSVTVAENGKKALDLFKENPPGTFDVILMDMMMPVMDGIETTKQIRALNRPDAKTVPIIAMTANAFTEDAERCIAAGMNAHLAKPLDINMLFSVIAQCKNKQS